MVNYQLGKIYKIVDNTNEYIYIGSTCEPNLSRRLSKHVSNYKRFLSKKQRYVTSFDIIKNNNYEIILVELYPCNTKDELHSRERFYIQSMAWVVNKTIPTRTLKEYLNEKKQIYYENNKEKIDEKNDKKRFKLLTKHNFYQKEDGLWYSSWVNKNI